MYGMHHMYACIYIDLELLGASSPFLVSLNKVQNPMNTNGKLLEFLNAFRNKKMLILVVLLLRCREASPLYTSAKPT